MTNPSGEDAAARTARLQGALYALLVTNLPSSAVMMFDHDLRFVLADGPELARNGSSKAQLEGKLLFDAVDPGFARLVEPNLRAALAGRRFTAELPFGELTYFYTYLPLPDEHGSVRYALVVAQDVTPLRQVEQRALRSEARVREIVGGLPAVVFVIGADRTIRFSDGLGMNVLGLRPGDVVGRQVDDVYPERVLGDLNRALRGERVTADAELNGVVWETSFAPIIGADGRVVEVVGVALDVTARRRALRLDHERQKLEAIGRLAGGIAHDFNNMLTVISGNVEMALSDVNPTDPLHQRLTEIHHAAEHSTRLTQQLLSFARRQVVQPITLNLNETISDELFLLRRLIGEQIDLVWEPGADLWSIQMDPSQVEQLLTNMCLNARDAIAGAGKVTLSTANVHVRPEDCAVHPEFAPGRFVRLTIADDGRGMSADTMGHIFEPFFTTKDVGEGTGLGLATVFGVVNQNGGFLSVSSEPGRGTTFAVYLPRTEVAPETIAPYRPADQAGIPRGAKETVLLVEDDPHVLDLGRRMLSSLGYDVLVADSPSKALSVFAERGTSVDLLLSDVVMPEMSGRQLADRLRAIRPDLKCLFMSGYTEELVARHWGGADELVLVRKPFSLSTLAGTVRQVLDRDVRS
jgi:two-component system cell cycle sensor histidine kinase/response regulator CckA